MISNEFITEKRIKSMKEARSKRELLLEQANLQRELNEDDEARDYAAEEVSISSSIPQEKPTCLTVKLNL